MDFNVFKNFTNDDNFNVNDPSDISQLLEFSHILFLFAVLIYQEVKEKNATR